MIYRQRVNDIGKIAEGSVAPIHRVVNQTRSGFPNITINVDETVPWQLIRDLVPAPNRCLIFSPKPWRPRKTDCRSKVVAITRPYALIGVRCAASDEAEFRQFALLRSAARHPVADAAAGIPEDSLIASNNTGREGLAGCTEDVWYPHEVITKAKVDRKARSDFPVILHKKIDLILMPIADL